MKNKSQRHKAANTFKFQPFAERIANINVDIFHQVGHEYEDQTEEEECFFFQAIQKWNVLNLTEGFDEFRKDVRPHNILTLPQLLHRKEHCVQTLLNHLKKKNILCLQPLLELVVALAKDLRKDFYPYYPQFLEILLELLGTKDTDQLEWTFTCLAYIFKFLWRVLVKDINTVFTALVPLLSDTKPIYINEFAAESFSFVARKVKDKKAFLFLMLKAVKTHKDGINGCAKLLSEMVCGVNGQFHSCAETMFPFFMESLSDEKFLKYNFFAILEQVIVNIIEAINPQKSELFWKTFVTQFETVSKQWQIKKDPQLLEILRMLLKLAVDATTFKGGRFLNEPKPIIEAVIKLYELDNLPESTLLNITELGVLLLMSRNLKHTQEQSSKLIRKILGLNNESVLFYVAENAVDYTMFEPAILPTFLKYCVSKQFDINCLKSMANLLVKKSPPATDGIGLLNWGKYSLDFGKKPEIENLFYNNVKMESIENVFEQFPKYYCSILCISHLNLSSSKIDDFVKCLLNNIKIFSQALNGQEDLIKNRQVLFAFLITLEALLHITDNVDKVLNLNDLIFDKILPLCIKLEYIAALKIVDLYLTYFRMNKTVISMGNLLKLHSILENNLSSPYHEIRLLTTHIYSLFNDLEELPKTELESWNIFKLCHHAESTNAQVDTYRDILNDLEKFGYEKPQMSLCKNTEFNLVPVRYLCGVLYTNFSLLWEPVLKILASQATGLPINDFWSVFVQELKTSVENIRNPIEMQESELSSDFQLLEENFHNSFNIESNPDFVNYRILLWKGMLSFPEVAEAKNRDISEIFLNFISNEYVKSNSESALTWNIKQKDSDETVMETTQNEVSEEDEIKKQLQAPVAKSGAKSNVKALLQHLKVFGKIKSPKSMYKEPELNRLYQEFLTHKNPEVQKAAMDCIMTYKHKYLNPYKENLYNLIDDKNFKKELTFFRVDQESPLVLTEHREELLPVVIKIMFSKMFAKTGMRTGGKASGQARRNMILKFLGGCQEKEMMNFIRMAFKYYAQFIKEDITEMINELTHNVDLEKFIPPKRLQSTINLLTVVLEHFGGHISNELLHYLLKVLLVIGSHIRGAFLKLSDIHSGYLTALRNIRVSSFKILEKYFKSFDKYPWSIVEINAIFETFIWPYADKLSVEGIHSPTSLLKLITVWGSNPRYFKLLVKHHPENCDYYILPHVIKLLSAPKTNKSVVVCIMGMIQTLVSLEEDKEDLELKLEVDNVRPIEENILARLKLDEKLNYGSCILLPFANSVLSKIKQKLCGKNKNVSTQELFILSRISELVWEADISDSVLELLLPIVNIKCGSGAREDTVLEYATTIFNLIQKVENPSKHIKDISPLFSEVLYPGSRKLLCKVLEVVSKKDESLKEVAELITELNACDLKWVDQPDFVRRLASFKKIQELAKEGSISVELGLLVIFNCYYFIRSEKDLSLRESSTYTWKLVALALIKQKLDAKVLDYVLDNTLLNLIRRGMKSKSEDVRTECILLLGHLARECPEPHPVLRDLNKLTDKVDEEVDFFYNLVHLQIHRHNRALQKIIKVLSKLETAPSPRTLTQFILPFISYYLLTEKYASKNSIIDSGIEATGLICKLLPWHQYEALLRFYLDKLRHKIEFQKQLVRLIVVILDAFHFDLNKGYVKEMIKKIGLDLGDELQKAEDLEQQQNERMEVDEGKVNSDVENKSKVNGDVEKMEVDGEDNEEEEGDNVKGDDGEEENDEKVEEEEVDLDDLLDKESVDEEEEEKDENEEVEKEEPLMAYQKIQILSKNAATRVIHTIQRILLPQLHKSLAVLTQYDASHKVNKKKTSMEREEQDLLKVPISLAVVKLLQRLPKGILEMNLPGIFMKICTFLKSQLESVRRTARDTLQKIMLTIGTEHLPLLLREVTPLMTRGYQVHVLVYTVHAVLHCLKDLYKAGDIDNILLTVVSLCRTDLFGSVAEEKEVVKIGVRISEAKSSKSVDTFLILSQYITDRCLMDLVLPLKEILMTTHSHKTVLKAQECLRQIALGLVDNKFVNTDSLIKFSYGISSESIPQLVMGDKKPQLTEKEREKLQRQKEDCFIIPKAPVGKAGIRVNNVKLSMKTNAHVIVEFGLRLCYFLLKRDKVKEDDYLPLLDPFSDVFKKCLESNHVKLSTVTLQCLGWFLKYELPLMKQNIEDISASMFAILHKYAAAGLSKGDNFDLVAAAFKTMSVLVREVKYHTISSEQLKILLLYVEQDMHDTERQSIAFNLLKAIISRKLIIPEIHDVMMKVAELSVISETDHVRNQSRIVFHQYLMDYPLGKKVDQYVAFYLSQLKYEMKYGRESALEMIQNLINSFPLNVLKNQSGTFLINLGARLLNDEFPEVRKKIANSISLMFQKLPKNDKDPLFEIILLWMKDRKIPHKHMGCQLIGLLVAVEKTSFETRLNTLMPYVLMQFGLSDEDNKPGRFVKAKPDIAEEENEEKARTRDHHLFQAIQMCLKLCAHSPSFLKRVQEIEKLGNYMQSLLCYPHEWVRMAASQFLGYIFTTIDIQKLAKLIENDQNEEEGFLYSNAVFGVKTLALDLCDQLQPGIIKTDFAEQIVKNLVFIARVLAIVPLTSENDTKINLLWLTKRLRKTMNREIVESPQSEIIRTEIFKWIGAVASVLEPEQINSILNHLMAPLVREMITTETQNAPLRQLSKEVAKIIKSKIGIDKYTDALSKVEMHITAKKAERKRKATQMAVTDPEAFAKKKIRRQEKKKEKRPRSQRKLKAKKKKNPEDDDDLI